MEVTAAETGTQWAKLRGRLFTPKEKASVDLAESHEFPWAVMRRALQRPPVLLLLLVPVAMALNLYVLRPSKRSAMTRAVVAHGKPASAIARALHIADRPWGGAPPGWCKGLIAHPLERPRVNRVYPDCDRGRFGAVCKEDGRPRFFSQYNQDIWLFQNVSPLHLIVSVSGWLV